MRLKIFFISLFLSMPLWLGVNLFAGKLENFLFVQELSKNPQIFTAQANLDIDKIKEFVQKRTQNDLEINAKAAISVLVSPTGEKRILFQKNIKEQLPIASLTKLMAAYVVLENLDLNKIVKVSQKAVDQKEKTGFFKPGETFTAQGLLYSSLIESSNDAVYALAETISEDGFIALMNLEANYMGLKSTHFVNSTGLDPDNNGEPSNLSTAEDLAKLIIQILNKPLIKDIISTSESDLYSSDGQFHHRIITTNELLKSPPPLNNWKVIGGKTGWDSGAGGCLILILQNTESGDYLVNVILGSDDRFGEMVKLINGVIKQ